MDFERLRSRHADEISNMENTGDISEECYRDFFEYFLGSGEMPYGVAKARTGDPYEWIFQRIVS
jgi:hydroxymethylglutaryl-CoA reductase